MDITSLTAVELGKKIKAKEISVVEAVKASIAQIEKVEKDVNSFVTMDKEGALKRAEEVQKLIDDGKLTGPLAGVPVAIKDNMCTQGMLTTCSSKILGNFRPMFTAEAVKNLEEAGAVILGKTNMDEFAMGSTTETSYYGPTKNPWNLEHVPGGSSGGSCAAVAAEEAPYALGPPRCTYHDFKCRCTICPSGIYWIQQSDYSRGSHVETGQEDLQAGVYQPSVRYCRFPRYESENGLTYPRQEAWGTEQQACLTPDRDGTEPGSPQLVIATWIPTRIWRPRNGPCDSFASETTPDARNLIRFLKIRR